MNGSAFVSHAGRSARRLFPLASVAGRSGAAGVAANLSWAGHSGNRASRPIQSGPGADSQFFGECLHPIPADLPAEHA